MRRKTIPEIRSEILKSKRLKSKTQQAVARGLSLNQGTISRVMRGRFVRWSPAVERVCEYANISCMTKEPLPALDATIEELAIAFKQSSRGQRSVIKLLRLVRELSETLDT